MKKNIIAYNVRIFEKRYINLSKEDIPELLDLYAARIAENSRCSLDNIKFEIRNISDSYRRVAFYGNNGKIIVSLNRVKLTAVKAG